AGTLQLRWREQFPDIVEIGLVEKTLVDWSAVRPLTTAPNLLWQPTFPQFPQEILFGQPAEFEVCRQPAAEFNHAAVKERKTAFDGMSHGHAIALSGQQVL